mgnify:CR=1 FL=1
MRSFFITLLALTAAPAFAQPAAPTHRLIGAETGLTVAVTVNGQPLRLRVDPGSGLMLNLEAARRIGLRGSMLAVSARVGPVRLRGHSKVARLRIGAWEGRRRFIWFDREVVEGADGTIGLADLPEDEVRMELGPVGPGQVHHVFAVESENMLGLVHRFRVRTQDAIMRFSFLPPDSQVTAALGAILAEAQGGDWNGEAREAPILFGVVRPLRPMRFARPLMVGGYGVAEINVRTSDWRGDHALPADEDEGDPSEMVVTGQRRGMRPLYRMTLGRDRLAACSSLLYSRPRQQLVLTCSPP